MKILLINVNPVVSRLLALCTRDEHIVLDEVEGSKTLGKVSYDILFVDEGSYVNDVKVWIEKLEARKKVFISYSGESMAGFDESIKKPFLPSQIIKVIESVDMSEMSENVAEEAAEMSGTQEDMSTKILNSDEIARIKALLDMDDDEIEINEDEFFDNDAYEARKIKVIKEHLIADGLEILEEDEMVRKLSASVEMASEKLNKKLKKIKKRHKKKTALDEDERIDLEEALSAIIAKLNPKKIKKLLNGEEIKIKIKLEDD